MKKHGTVLFIIMAWLVTTHQSMGFKMVDANTYAVTYASYCSTKPPVISSARYKFTDEKTGTAMIIPVQGATLTGVASCPGK